MPAKLNKNICVDKKDLDSCIGCTEHTYKVDDINTRIRLHYLKFDGNGQPMFIALANLLYKYIIDYCISFKSRTKNLTTHEATKLTKEARKLFRHPPISDDNPDRTGEAGEILLFFLIEAVLGAPQVVAKMELKTNHKDEVKGSDGIHARFNKEENLVDFYFGEAKLFVDVKAAIKSALSSIDSFHQKDMLEHEFNLVTKHFKYSDELTKKSISDLIVSGKPGEKARVNHACLIGYNYKEFNNIRNSNIKTIKKEFLEKYIEDAQDIIKSLQAKVVEMKCKHLTLEVFFLPFPSVDDFRNAFNKALD